MKNVQIPYDLFLALLQYHLMMEDDYEEEIRYGLEQKLEAMVRHELYAKYKTAPTSEEREAACQRYLDEHGVPGSFSWSFSFDDRDRNVPRSCYRQTRKGGSDQNSRAKSSNASPVPIEKYADFEMGGQSRSSDLF